MERDDVMTSVLVRFAGANPELPNGFAEHAPMGAEALLALGVDPSAVATWAGRHTPEPLAAASPLHRVRGAVLDEVRVDGWRTVVARRAGALVPRLDAHLFHGLIRTAHAVRVLERREDDHAVAELATALAAWTAWGRSGRERFGDDVAPPPSGLAPLDAVLDAARRGAAAFAAGPSIFTLHAVTAPMAYLLLAPHLTAADHERAAAALARSHRRYGPVEPVDDDEASPFDAAERRALADRWDAHPAKLVEAALRGHEASGDAVFLRAARTV